MAFEEDKLNSDGLYDVVDIDMVAALTLNHIPVSAIKSKVNPKRVTFSFEPTVEFLQDIQDYKERVMKVEPKSYYHQLRDIRYQINNILENN